MENSAFDDIIKKQIEEAQAELNMDHWLEMSKRLDQEFGVDQTSESDAKFDKSVKNKVDRIRIPSESNSWQLLEEKIIQDRILRRKVFFVKMAELCIVLLIIFTCFNLNLFDHFFGNSRKAPMALLEQSKKDTNTKNSTVDRRFAITQNTVVLEQKHSLIDPAIRALTDNKTTATAHKTKSNQTLELSKRIPTVDDRHAQYHRISYPISDASPSIVVTAPTVDHTLSQDRKQSQYRESLSSIAQLPLRTTYLEANNILRHEEILLFEKDQLPSIITSAYVRSNTTWLNAFVASDLNLINSPFDMVFRTPSYLMDDLGGSIGATISSQKGTFELESGIVFSQKNYEPRRNGEVLGDFISGYLRTSLNEISFDIFSIPLNIKWHMTHNKKWSLYMMTGLSANIISKSSYKIEREYLTSSPGIVESNFNYSPTLSQKTYENGILEGGSLASNIYLSSSVGLGIQRNFSNSVAMYLQASYTYHTLGTSLGPNNDRIHHLSLQVGVKMGI